jgi:hypothetical protein
MDTRKILPDPDLHYGIAPEEEGHTIQKAPQRPRKARRASQTSKEGHDTTDEVSEASRPVLDGR